ncbi:cupin domain-containing protein [Streptomyces sp. DSM 41524]|uniref:Cupin domain-containing protein n=1 Tax=Streptomyces asiaticus subsp. ignotus TaxID=3098222 RepID=A0ABU7QCT9_9ACTN|nr:cupin domain-containing protein [Streptomyces sp. DSM 41524]
MEIDAEMSTPVHIIDREQVWMPVSGEFEVVVDGVTERVKAGQAIVLPAGVVRQMKAVDSAAEAFVAMTVGGKAMMPGSENKIPLPWAE